MKTKESLLKLIQDSTNELAMLIATEDVVQVPKVGSWWPRHQEHSIDLSYITDSNLLTRATLASAGRTIDELTSYLKLLAYRDEYCPYYVYSTKDENYCIYYDYEAKTYCVESYRFVKALGKIYFDETTAKQLCEALNNGSYTL